jgi:pimeloyl-ACP methyl ester carboxylesterase
MPAGIAVVGPSWGSMLGLRMIAKGPELFSVYVGTGQNVMPGPEDRLSAPSRHGAQLRKHARSRV